MIRVFAYGRLRQPPGQVVDGRAASPPRGWPAFLCPTLGATRGRLAAHRARPAAGSRRRDCPHGRGAADDRQREDDQPCPSARRAGGPGVARTVSSWRVLVTAGPTGVGNLDMSGRRRCAAWARRPWPADRLSGRGCRRRASRGARRRSCRRWWRGLNPRDSRRGRRTNQWRAVPIGRRTETGWRRRRRPWRRGTRRRPGRWRGTAGLLTGRWLC
jgi:hypothetical protein